MSMSGVSVGVDVAVGVVGLAVTVSYVPVGVSVGVDVTVGVSLAVGVDVAVRAVAVWRPDTIVSALRGGAATSVCTCDSHVACSGFDP